MLPLPSLIFLACISLSGCAAQQPAQQIATDRPGAHGPGPAQVLQESRAQLLADANEVLGPAALTQVMRAETAILVRSATSFPRMIRQPDGSWKREPPGVAAAVRSDGTWLRIGAGGIRNSFDAAAATQLDRLLGNPAFWSEPPIVSAPCTDPSGIIMLARRAGREFVSPYPCGLTGLTGQAASLVLSGHITDWSKVDPDLRPAGLPLARFDEATQAQYRFTNGIYEERLIAIHNEGEWDAQWRRMMMPMGKLPPLPNVDFPREMLLLAAMGPQRSGGYSVTIDKVIDQRDELLAFVRFVAPGSGCGAIAAITSPADIVRIPASSKSVRWIVDRQVSDCG